MRKAVKNPKWTVFAWNDRQILIRYTDGDEEKVLALLTKKLHHKKDDPRWQILPGKARVQRRR